MTAPRVLRLVLEQTLEAGAEVERSKLPAQRLVDICFVWLEIGDGIGTGEASETQQVGLAAGDSFRTWGRRATTMLFSRTGSPSYE